MEKHKLLYEHQYGSQKTPKHFTNHALIAIIEKIRSALDQNIFACSIFIDLQKNVWDCKPWYTSPQTRPL